MGLMASIAERIARIEKECAGVWGQSGITDWERQRMNEWRSKTSLSPNQERVLLAIEGKAFGDDDG